ncbi:MAG: type II secretion system protein [Turicibacter sp.]|nr:type II secretion system protein [Turicibacter sp.]
MRINQKGYILIECLISLMILSTVCLCLVYTIPNLLVIEKQLATEQLIYQKLYEIKDQSLFYETDFETPIHFNNPISYIVTKQGEKWCATYKRGDTDEKMLCF